jgi:hypothetical protein
VNTDDEQILSISELFLLPDQLRDGLLCVILLQGIPVSLIGETAFRHRGLLPALLLRSESGPTGCYLSATCNNNLDQAVNELLKLRTRHELILYATGQGIHGLDVNGKDTFGNAATMEILCRLTTQIQPSHL